jgi:hypothetical protein
MIPEDKTPMWVRLQGPDLNHFWRSYLDPKEYSKGLVRKAPANLKHLFFDLCYRVNDSLEDYVRSLAEFFKDSFYLLGSILLLLSFPLVALGTLIYLGAAMVLPFVFQTTLKRLIKKEIELEKSREERYRYHASTAPPPPEFSERLEYFKNNPVPDED